MLYGLLKTRHQMQEKKESTVTSIPSYSFKDKLVKLIYKNNPGHQPKYFLGMNPSHQFSIKFDSDFEGGNLDFVVQSGINEYDLFVRNDSNTRGHTQWYYFSVESSSNQRFAMTILNMHQLKNLYQQGMKPYIFDSSHPTRGWY